MKLKTIALIIALAVSALIAATTDSSTANAKSGAEAMKVLDDYLSAFNLKDVAAWERTFHFPHYRLAGATMEILAGPGQQDVSKLPFSRPDWRRTQWERRRIIHASETKVHIDTKFTRLREDGTPIGSFESLYIVTRESGRWGVRMRSTYAEPR